MASDPPRILLVDDEENVLKALRRLFCHQTCEQRFAASGAEALALVETEGAFDVVITDQRMPGMSGVELLKEIRKRCPESVRIILSGYSDVQSILDAVNDGAIYKFLTKPWDDAALASLIQNVLADLAIKREHAALQERVTKQNEELAELNRSLEAKVTERTGELQTSLKLAEELNESLRQQNIVIVKAFAGLLELRSQALGAHCRRVAGLVQPVCERLGIRERQEVQNMIIAALLHDIGKIALPDAVLLKDPSHLGSNEREEVARHPVLGQAQVQVIDGLSEVARVIRHHHENVGGSGYPDGLVEEEIPLGSRVIRVLDAYDLLTKGGHRTGVEEKLALEAMDRQVSRSFDGRVYTALLDVLQERKDGYDPAREVKVPIRHLAVGMVLSRDLTTRSGILLVPKDEAFRPSYLEKIRSLSAAFPTDAFAYVYRAQQERSAAER